MREHNAEYFKNYYLNQAQQKGGHLVAFHGARNQRGYGLGGIFRGLYRWAIPHLQSVGQRALKEGVGVAQDVLNGEKLGDSVLKRGEKVIGSMASQNASQKGAGQKGRKRKAQTKSVSRAPTKRRKTSPAKKADKSPFNQFFP